MDHCSVCHKRHPELPGAIGYLRPAHYFMVPEADREARIRINEDLCQIDDQFFLIRGVIEVPLLDGATIEGTPWFEWGMWAAVSSRSFHRYLELYEVDGSAEPPFDGLLSGEPPGYADLLEHPVSVQLRTATQRPLLILKPSNHRLYLEQTQGITLQRVHEIFAESRPELFE
jgi:hypothetical protein